jgi:hypothetical protein
MVPLVASAQNTTFGTAATLAVSGKGKNQFYNNAGNLNTFYVWFTAAGKSYCVETEGADFERTYIDTVLTVYRADQTTVIGSSDDVDSPEFTNYAGSRVCYIATATESNYAKVVPFSATATPQYYNIRVVENTLYSPWFFSGGGFEAFILIKNASVVARQAVVTLYDPAGAVIATSASLSVPANGSRNFQVSAAAPAGFGISAVVNGGVRISSTAPLGSLVANVTSLSFGQGVSFDTPATPRPDWASR